jgi:hypothetical protein
MTVEGLHTSFEKIDNHVRKLIERGKTDKALAMGIRQAWQEQFHHMLSEPALKGLVSHYRSVNKRHTRRNQRGGMAPMDWTMGPGTSDIVYGRFPVDLGTVPSVVRSLDRFYESPVSRACDSTGGHPAPQKGGAFFSNGSMFDSGIPGAIAMGHPPYSAPPTGLQIGVGAIQGVQGPPGPSPVAASVPLAQPHIVPYDASVTNMKEFAPVFQGF